MFCKRMATIHKKGRDLLDELHEAHRAESERLLGVFGEVLADVREALGLGGLPDPATGEDPIDTWDNNILAESQIRYGGYAVWRTGISPTPTSPCSAGSFPAGCGRRCTSSTGYCATIPIFS
jgi:hypothetical protein